MAKMDISKLMQRAEEAMNRRNYGLAIFSLINAVSLQPDNIDARMKLRATQTRAATENGTSTLKALLGLIKAKVQTMMGKHEQAIIACENALTANPTHAGLMRLLADNAEQMGFWEAAAWQRKEIADKHAQEDTTNLHKLAVVLDKHLGRGDEALKCYDRIQEINPNIDLDQDIRDLQARMTSDVYAKGVSGGSHSMLHDEEEAEVLEMRQGRMKTDEQRQQVIAYILEHDAKERPDDHRVFIELGDICYDMDDWATGYVEAKKFYTKAGEINSTDSVVDDKLGDLEIKKIRVELMAAKNRCQENPDDAEAKAAYQDLARKRLEYEIAEYERRVKDQPLKDVFHYHLGELYFQAKRYDEAISELQQAAKGPKYKITALTMLGRSFHAMGQFEMAVTQFQRARAGEEIFDKIKESIYFEAVTQEARGDEGSNVEAWQEALKLFTLIYETEISFRDVKERLPALQKKIKEA